jgi:endonuclease/exonuclease/phosphatase (EEP) superfamily protein YafD
MLGKQGSAARRPAQQIGSIRHRVVHSPDHRVRAAVARILNSSIIGVVALVVGLVVLLSIAPQQTGILALVQLVLPHIVLVTLVVAIVVTAGLRSTVAALVLIALVVLTFVRFGSDWLSVPGATPDGERVALLSWNLEIGARAADHVASPILDHDADVVALQELTPDAAAAFDADPRIIARYPYRFLVPDSSVFGLGVLSAYPIVDHATFGAPVAVVVTLDVGSGRRMTVMDTHPMHAEIGSSGGFPVAYDARDRDRDLTTVHSRAEAIADRGIPFVLLGDFNTSPTEPGYALLTRGLRDVHVEVGSGPGWTWRPSRLEAFRIGVLRIDMALIGPGVEPVSSSVDCGYPGDHCLMQATVAIP